MHTGQRFAPRRSIVAAVFRAIVFPLIVFTGAITRAQDQPSRQPAADAAKATSSKEKKKTEPDWAEKYLTADPLAGKDVVTLDDLKRGLEDDLRRDTLIERHFARATGLSREQQQSFLSQALQHTSPAVARQAAAELNRLALLEQVVGELLLASVKDGGAEQRQDAIVALELIRLKASDVDESYLKALIEALGSGDPLVRQAGLRQLQDLGVEAVPALLQALGSDDPGVRTRAAAQLSRAVGSKRPTKTPTDTAGPSGEGVEHPALAKAPLDQRTTTPTARSLDEKQSETVRVYYGTNRERLVGRVPLTQLILYPLLIVGVLAGLYFRFRPRPSAESPTTRRGCLSMAITLGLLVFGAWSFSQWNVAVGEYFAHHRGTKFGVRRADGGEIYYGYCDVSIPREHERGQVERPLIGPEDEFKHVVIKQIAMLDDEEFYAAVKEEIAKIGADSRDCFVFVHGFNVDFEEAAQRTAQIHYDLQFEGAPLFYSWPSRGSIRHYFSDRGEIQYSQDHIRRFLEGVHERVDADRIHVIAHSMGADAFCRAIMQMDPEQRIFDQIVLAAPDIDADVFEQQIVPRLTDKGRRTTMYCSRRDWALHASYTFNDSPRVGDSSRRIMVAIGMDTIDASDLDTELIGHGYYGDCLPLLKDVGMMIERNLSPSERNLRATYVQQLPYWTLDSP